MLLPRIYFLVMSINIWEKLKYPFVLQLPIANSLATQNPPASMQDNPNGMDIVVVKDDGNGVFSHAESIINYSKVVTKIYDYECHFL